MVVSVIMLPVLLVAVVSYYSSKKYILLHLVVKIKIGLKLCVLIIVLKGWSVPI